MAPSIEAVSAIRARVVAVSAWTKSDGEVLADLKADAIPNPAPRARTPKSFRLADLIDATAPASRANLGGFVGPAAPLVMTQDRPNLIDGIDSLQALGALTQADRDALAAIIEADEDDPSWPASVPAIEATLGRPIDIDDVAASRPGA